MGGPVAYQSYTRNPDLTCRQPFSVYFTGETEKKGRGGMARPKLGDSESKRLQMVITEDELEAIDTWQHDNRVASRSEAIRRLTQIGLRVSDADFVKRTFLPLEGLRDLRSILENAFEQRDSRKEWTQEQLCIELEETFTDVSAVLAKQADAFVAMLSLVDEVAALKQTWGGRDKDDVISIEAAKAEAASIRKGYEAGAPDIEMLAVRLIADRPNKKKEDPE